MLQINMSKTNVVANFIAEKILTGSYKSETLITGENDIAIELKVSRGSVRAAIQKLASKGMLSTIPKTGTMVNLPEKWNWLDVELLNWVSQFNTHEELIPNLMEARLIFEPNIAALAALNFQAKDLVALEEGYQLMEQGERERNRETFNIGDIKFHKALIAGCHNCFLMSMGDALITSLGMVFEQTLEKEIELSVKAVEFHYELMESIRMRDAEKARAMMRSIIMDAISKTIGDDVVFPKYII